MLDDASGVVVSVLGDARAHAVTELHDFNRVVVAVLGNLRDVPLSALNDAGQVADPGLVDLDEVVDATLNQRGDVVRPQLARFDGIVVTRLNGHQALTITLLLDHGMVSCAAPALPYPQRLLLGKTQQFRVRCEVGPEAFIGMDAERQKAGEQAQQGVRMADEARGHRMPGLNVLLSG